LGSGASKWADRQLTELAACLLSRLGTRLGLHGRGRRQAQNPGKQMKIRLDGPAGRILLTTGGVVCLGISFTAVAGAQERTAALRKPPAAAPRSMAYVASRETVVQGTVVKFEEASKEAPIGAHAQVQTASGIIDVHLGPSSHLRSNHFSLASGDVVRITGARATTRQGGVLLAQTVQRGSDTIVVRSPRGFVVGAGGVRASAAKNGTQSFQRGAAR
jgi:hypothetical protein